MPECNGRESSGGRVRDIRVPIARRDALGTVLLLCVSLLLPPVVRAHEPAEVLVLSNTTLPPVTTPAGSGYLNQLYAEWFPRAGLSAELMDVPAARALQNANAGIYDGDAARTDIDPDQYPDLHKVPEPLMQIVLSGFHLDPDIEVRTMADLEKYRVGYVRGWRTAERLLADSTAIALRDADGVMDMLEARRLDIGILTVAPGRKLSEARKMETLQLTEMRIEKNMYLYVHTRHLDRIPELVEALKAMKSDGSYDAIMAGYIAENR